MTPRVRLLRQLTQDGMYVIDAGVIAGAILARAQVRALVPEVILADTQTSVRSFRHDPSARSFRLVRPASRRHATHR